MTGPEAGDAFLEDVMAASIIEGDGRDQGQKKGQAIESVSNKDSHQAGNAYMKKIVFHGDERHECLHYWGLKMLVDPVE